MSLFLTGVVALAFQVRVTAVVEVGPCGIGRKGHEQAGHTVASVAQSTLTPPIIPGYLTSSRRAPARGIDDGSIRPS